MLGVRGGSSSSPSDDGVYRTNVRRKAVPLRSISRDDIRPGILFRVTDGICLIKKSDRLSGASGGSSGYASIISKTGEEWDWRGAEASIKRPERTRPRSFSMTDRMDYRPSMVNIDTESESDYPTISNQPIIKRRASISTPTSSLITVYTGSLSHLVPNQYLQTTSRRVSTHGTAPGCACTSCGSTVTPYWRDGWATDVMLCNACGLRYQKFARRCPMCMYIPRKEDSLGDRCIKCNNLWIVGSLQT